MPNGQVLVNVEWAQPRLAESSPCHCNLIMNCRFIPKDNFVVKHYFLRWFVTWHYYSNRKWTQKYKQFTKNWVSRRNVLMKKNNMQTSQLLMKGKAWCVWEKNSGSCYGSFGIGRESRFLCIVSFNLSFW